MKPDTKKITLQQLEKEETLGPGKSTDTEASEASTDAQLTTLQWVHQFFKSALLDNFSLKLVALILASTVFVLVHSDEQATVRTDMSVRYGELSDRVLVSESVDHVQLTLQGSRRRIKRFNDRNIGRIVYIDLENETNGYFAFDESLFTVPEGLRIVETEPEGINLKFEKKIKRKLPVYADTLGIPARGLKVSAVSTKPSEVWVAGAINRLDNISRVRTKEIHLGERDTSFQTTVDLIEDGFELLENQRVEVQVSLGEELDRKVVDNKSIQVLVPEGTTVPNDLRIDTNPARVDVLLYGTAKQLASVDTALLEVIAFAEPQKALALTPHEASLKTRPVFPGIAVTVSPATVNLIPSVTK